MWYRELIEKHTELVLDLSLRRKGHMVISKAGCFENILKQQHMSDLICSNLVTLSLRNKFGKE